MPGKLKKNILITGTSSGIGESVTKKISKFHDVIGVSRHIPVGLEGGKNYTHITCDLSISENRDKIRQYYEQSDKKIDVLLLNAGVGYFDNFENIPLSDYEYLLQLNLHAPIGLTHALLPFLSEKAKIIFIGSICSKKFMKYGAVYQASKFGLRGFAG
ncbi:MAG: SDR family NAD(P)-dependent oxidoreductase, partial [Candidatus Gracilibacteria bacterium]|nr:SDR family NAD(P)-dependent oxidoreductase [Candidatus Gracilibacteria bacterium]